MKKEMNETVNNANAVANHSRARKLDLGTIAQIMENESSTGFISKDLYDALKMADAAGLCAEDKPLPEILMWEERKLDYGAEKLSKEADVTLLLRAKAGDKEASERLFMAKMPIIKELASKLEIKYRNVPDILENSYDDFLSIVSEAFMVHITQHPVCAQGKILFSHTNLKFIVNEIIEDRMLYTTASGRDQNIARYISQISKKMKACNIDVKSVTQEQYIDFCLRKKICQEPIAKAAYVQQASIFGSTESITGKPISNGQYLLEGSNREETDLFDDIISKIAVDFSQTPFIGEYTNYYNFNPENIVLENSDFIEAVQKIKDKYPKYQKDIETLFAHVLGDAHFDFKNIMAVNADDFGNRQKTAEMMDFESIAEVIAACKKARELIFKTIFRKYPELFSEITKEIANVKKISW